MPALKVSLIEDDEAFRASVATMLAGTPGFACASAHPSAEHALAHLPAAGPDVVVVDLELPRASGIDAIRRLRTVLPRTQFLMLTAFEDPPRIFEALQAGASGYLLKRTPPARLLEAIQEVHAGGAPMSASVARLVVQSFHHASPSPDALAALSPREEEVLCLLAEGARTKEVADRLGIAVATVQSHVQHIYEKLHARSRTEAVAKYLGR